MAYNASSYDFYEREVHKPYSFEIFPPGVKPLGPPMYTEKEWTEILTKKAVYVGDTKQ